MSTHLRVINLKCVNCGAQLEISPDMTRFACGYCGAEQLVQRSGGTVALQAVTDAVAKVQAGTDKTAAELALFRLQAELRQLDDDYDRKLKTARVEKVKWPLLSNLVFLGGAVVAIIAAGLVRLISEDATMIVLFGIILISGLAAYMVKWKHGEEIDDKVRRAFVQTEERKQEIRAQIAKNQEIVNR